ncbi:MAG: hypothetical protein AB7V14_04285 [Kiritimatiellia bacterium]
MKGKEPARVELRCPACGRDSWLRRVPVYEGFVKTGESLTCALCGHAFASEAEIPFKDNRPKVFSENDRPRPVKVFREDEKGKMCRYCAEYVVNPFLQRCSLHKCEVEATDTCPHFTPKPPPKEEEKAEAPNPLRP